MSFLRGWLLLITFVALPSGQATKGDSQPAPEKKQPARTDLYGDPLPAGAIARMGAVRFRPGYWLSSIALSPDGKTLASVAGAVALWEANTGKRLGELERVQFTGPSNVVFSPDGKTLASQWHDCQIRIWDIATMKLVRAITGTYAPCAFSPDGKSLASADSETVCLWEASSGQQIARLEGHSGNEIINCLAFSPDGKNLASGSDDKTVRLWNLAKANLAHELKGHEERITAVSFSPTGNILASASEDGTIRFWKPDDGKEVRHFSAHRPAVYCLAFSPDGKMLASGGLDSMIRLWDVAGAKELRALAGHQNSVECLVFSRDGTRLFSGSRDATVRLWDVATGKDLLPFESHQELLTSVEFSPDSQCLATLALDGTSRLWNVANGKELGCWSGPRDFHSSLAFAADGKRVFSSGGDDYSLCQSVTVRVQEVPKGKATEQVIRSGSPNCATAMNLAGNVLALGTEDGSVGVRDLRTGKQIRQIKAHEQMIGSLAFSADGEILVTTSLDGSLRLWDLRTGKESYRVPFAQAGVAFPWLYIAISADNKKLAVCQYDTVQLWNLKTKKLISQGEGENSAFNCVTFSPDGRMLATGSKDDLIFLWESATGQKIHQFRGHLGAVWAVAFSPDGRLLASGSSDTSALVWDITFPGTAGRSSRKELSGPELAALWDSLAKEASFAYPAIWRMVGAPRQTVAFLKERLHAVLNATPEQIARWISQLDDNDFSVREKAMDELACLGKPAEAALRQELKGKPSAEVILRIKILLGILDGSVVSTQWWRPFRAIQVLEYVGTPEAQELIRTLAKGAPEARLTQEAKASLERLAKRGLPMP